MKRSSPGGRVLHTRLAKLVIGLLLVAPGTGLLPSRAEALIDEFRLLVTPVTTKAGAKQVKFDLAGTTVTVTFEIDDEALDITDVEGLPAEAESDVDDDRIRLKYPNGDRLLITLDPRGVDGDDLKAVRVKSEDEFSSEDACEDEDTEEEEEECEAELEEEEEERGHRSESETSGTAVVIVHQ